MEHPGVQVTIGPGTCGGFAYAEDEVTKMGNGENREYDTLVTDSFIRCENPECNRLVSGDELKHYEGKCPLCGTRLAKPKKD